MHINIHFSYLKFNSKGTTWRPLGISKFFRDDTHTMSMKIFKFSRHPTLLSIYVLNSSTPWPWTSNLKLTTPPSPNNNQSIKRKHNPRMTIICYQVGFPLTSFHLAKASSAFLWLYALVCAVVKKYYEISFIYNYSHF